MTDRRPDPLTDPIDTDLEDTPTMTTTARSSRPELAVAKTASPIPAALDHARDRMARTDAIIADLRTTVGQLIGRLEPVLTDGAPATYPSDPQGIADTAAEDRRSTIARSITDLADHAQQQGDQLSELMRLVGAVIEHVEA